MYPAPHGGQNKKWPGSAKARQAFPNARKTSNQKPKGLPVTGEGKPKDKAIKMKTRFNLAQPAENTLSWAKRAKFYLSCPTERLRNRTGPRVNNGNSR